MWWSVRAFPSHTRECMFSCSLQVCMVFHVFSCSLSQMHACFWPAAWSVSSWCDRSQACKVPWACPDRCACVFRCTPLDLRACTHDPRLPACLVHAVTCTATQAAGSHPGSLLRRLLHTPARACVQSPKICARAHTPTALKTLCLRARP